MKEELSTACRAAADALEILSNLQPGFTRNVIPWINSSTAVSVSQANSGERQVNEEELQANESAVQSSTSPALSSTIQAWLATLFPTVDSNRASKKDTSRGPAKSKRTIKSTKGRPSKTLVYKDLVLISSPKISKVPTHTTRLQLEERELFCLEFPFEKSWDAKSLKTAILNRFPQVLLSEYVVNFHLCYSLKHCSTVKLKLKVAQNSFQHFPRGRF